jgi:phosphopantetheinyl transferase
LIHLLPDDLVVLAVPEVICSFEARGAHWLAPEEEEVRLTLALRKRHDEWLAGRIAAKRAVQRATGLPFSRLVIRASTAADNRGQPEVWIDGHRDKLGFLSISHSSGYAAACFGNAPSGLDLERVFVAAPGFEETAFSKAERERLSALSGWARSEAATQSWCAKEAYAKWLGRGFAVALHELEPANDTRVRVEHGRLPQDPQVLWARALNSANMCG